MQNPKSTTSYITIAFLLWSITLAAQEGKLQRQTLSSAGSSTISSIESKSILLQQSIGQASVIGTYHHNDNALRQGFIQPTNKEVKLKTEELIVVTVYPNPCTDIVQVEFEKSQDHEIDLQIFDITGQLLEQTVQNNNRKVVLNTSKLSSGIYFLRIQINNQTITKKISKS